MAQKIGVSNNQSETEVLRDIFQNLRNLEGGETLTISITSQEGEWEHPENRLFAYIMESSDPNQYVVVENPAFKVTVAPEL